ncbi:MAG: sigma-70 family RNA polymerase sigma factor [Candidatus Tectimicrobiota bacterium]
MTRSDPPVNLETFEATALPHLDACFHFALRLTRHVEDAEDLVQEAYLRALRFFHRFTPGTNFKAWIFKVLLNTYINAYRRRPLRGEELVSDNLEFLHDRMASHLGFPRDNDPERLAMTHQATAAINEALNKIPQRLRTVVHLADIEGCTYKEIASIVGCPMGTVMSRLHRGRRLLQAAGLAPCLGVEQREDEGERGPVRRRAKGM